MITSSTASFDTPARSSAAVTATAPSSCASTLDNVPPKEPIGVRAPATTTMRG
jgi:hypothetical protein